MSPRFRSFSLLAVAAAGLASVTQAQSTLIIRGHAVSAIDGQPLAGVTVRTNNDTTAVRTNTAGMFAVAIRALPVEIVATRIGFLPDTVLVNDANIVARLVLERSPLSLSPAVISAERTYSAASSSAIREFDIQLRPRESSQELLRLAPGLVIAQHAGGGKAEQLYLRGFDADHGTDVAVSVDGVPVNMVTHAHGQGYADLHWLMPEVVEGADVRKGPFDVRDGDFATAGSVSFRTLDRAAGPVVSARAGAFGTRHTAGLLPFGGDVTRPGGYLAASTQFSDGPFISPQRHRRMNAFLKATAPLGSGAEVVAAASAFDATWEASGQVPDRAVQAGDIPRFGAIDDSEGGATSRYDLLLGARSQAAGPGWEVRAFATKYDFDLYSNFTFFLNDSLNGDGIEQVDDRLVIGAFGAVGNTVRFIGRDGLLTVGAGTRTDDGDVALHSQRERERLGTRVDVHNRQHHLYQWTRYETALSPRLRADVGIRTDAFQFSVTDRIVTVTGSGSRWQAIVSPRLNLAFDASPRTQLFANAGTGFHSNDSRDVILATPGETVLPRAVSAELGARRTWEGGTLSLAAWWLDLESETVYVGDEGTTESSGRTRRVGIDVELRHQLTSSLWFDGDVNLARGRFRDEPAGASLIPLAPSRTATAGLTSRGERVEGGIRLRHIGSRTANEDNSVRALGSTTWEMFAAWNVGAIRVFGSVDNLFNTEWNEAQFSTTSRLRGESGPVTELHYTPGSPRAISIGVQYRF